MSATKQMASQATKKLKTPFVPRTEFPKYNILLSDFKGHHVKALKRIELLSPQLDLVVEIRDARAPLATRNVLFDRALEGKEKLICYSKSDLSDVNQELIRYWHKDENLMFIDCRKGSHALDIINFAKTKHMELFPPPPLGFRFIITGMPNVGKSTLTNTLRKVGRRVKTKVAQTGGQPGVTKSTSEVIKVCDIPPIYMYDTPGVFLPRVADIQTMISLALIGAVKPTLVDPYIQADYLLYLMNLQDPTGNLYGQFLEMPTNNIEVLLKEISKHCNKYNFKNNTYDEVGSALWWIDNFKQGKESKIIMDLDAIIQNHDFNMKDFSNIEVERVNNLKIKMNTKPSTKMTPNDRKMERANQLFKRKNKL